ncbi:MAG: exonuclease SbcCD subunit D [Anaerolineaceae bacterium]|nr:MAG: exonuclease SbcCD subunit D [Anaerolineaceae bacterium]
MSDPIRVLHFADAHIGMENYGKTDPDTGLSSRVVDFLRRMDDICDYATANDADLIVFAGDAFKTRTPNPTYQREFAHRIRDLSQVAPVVLLVGNHDVAPARMKASSVEIYQTLAVPNVWVAGDYEVRVIPTQRGDVVVGAVPYPIRSRILDSLPDSTAGLTIAETDQRLNAGLLGILEDMAAEADGHGDLPRLLTAHVTVTGAVVGSERNIMLGRDISLPRSHIADPRWDYVALGHIHKHQDLTAKRDDLPPAVYSGSIERIDFGEEGDAKGFCWVELTRGRADWRFVPLAARPFVTLTEDLRDSDDPTGDVIELIAAYDLRDAVVRLLLEFTPESEARFNEAPVRDALRRSGMFALGSLNKRVEQASRARLGVSPEGLTNFELLERYFISTDVAPERRAALLEVAEQIMARADAEADA